ncbi:MAG: tRNA (adenosine(37)-N6)-threonylcarbamoyltransferase complex dimerization subunit type 1 TsaB [Treponema sp.]|jgi:tRNA threonylcarbamoyladenosine biosynthesis protein TsaB|nr:tRNA (adenosine(37)-N6)-threonylcarbamoyltransferase complex dimerization subunit type 1 TsaB [Treponema sp.]
MNILALDTAASVMSIALSTGDDVWYFEAEAGLRHGELLMDAADRLLEGAGIGSADLDLAACMKGPGSFTGLRIAFAAAKGLSLALGIPMVAVPTLDCMAAAWASWPGIVLPAMDAKKGRFYAALYRGGRRLGGHLDAEPEELAAALRTAESAGEPVMLTGPAAQLVLEALKPPEPDRFFVDPQGKRGKARELLDTAKKTVILNAGDEVFSGPLYLRKSDAELRFEP